MYGWPVINTGRLADFLEEEEEESETEPFRKPQRPGENIMNMRVLKRYKSMCEMLRYEEIQKMMQKKKRETEKNKREWCRKKESEKSKRKRIREQK